MLTIYKKVGLEICPLHYFCGNILLFPAHSISITEIYHALFQDRLSSLPPAPRTPVTEFQHPPYFPPPFTGTMTLQPSQEVFSPSLQHLQSADPYQVTTTLHSFSPNQVGLAFWPELMYVREKVF